MLKFIPLALDEVAVKKFKTYIEKYYPVQTKKLEELSEEEQFKELQNETNMIFGFSEVIEEGIAITKNLNIDAFSIWKEIIALS